MRIETIYGDAIVYNFEKEKELVNGVLVNCLMFEAVHVPIPQCLGLRWPRRFSTDSTTKPLPSPVYLRYLI